MDILAIPGYLAAVRQERLVRDAAFLGITESIGPFECTPLTLTHYAVLRISASPFLYSETPSPQDLLNFLWLLNPEYVLGPAPRSFVRRCRKLFFPPTYLALLNTKRARARFERKRQARLAVAAQLIDKVRRFMAEATQDRPPAPITTGFDADYFSDAAYFCALFGREFGWPEETTLHMPMKRLFQYLNAIKTHHGSRIPLCNPSDKVKADYLRNLNSKLQPQNTNGN